MPSPRPLCSLCLYIQCGGLMLEKDVVGCVCTRSLERVIATLLEEVLQGLYSQAGVHWTRQECI